MYYNYIFFTLVQMYRFCYRVKHQHSNPKMKNQWTGALSQVFLYDQWQLCPLYLTIPIGYNYIALYISLQILAFLANYPLAIHLQWIYSYNKSYLHYHPFTTASYPPQSCPYRCLFATDAFPIPVSPTLKAIHNYHSIAWWEL